MFLAITNQLQRVLTVVMIGNVYAHSAMTTPQPRNAIDSKEKPWGDAVPHPLPFEPWCPIPSKAAAGSDDRNISGANGQACFWCALPSPLTDLGCSHTHANFHAFRTLFPILSYHPTPSCPAQVLQRLRNRLRQVRWLHPRPHPTLFVHRRQVHPHAWRDSVRSTGALVEISLGLGWDGVSFGWGWVG